MKKQRTLQRSDALWLGSVSLLVLLQFWWLPGDPRRPSDTYSVTLDGKRGLFQAINELSQAGALPPVRRESARLIPHDTGVLVMLGPDRYPDAREKEALAAFVRQGGVLVFGPNWSNPEFSLSELNIHLTPQTFTTQTATLSPQAGKTPNAPSGSSLPAEAEPDPENEESSAEGKDNTGSSITADAPQKTTPQKSRSDASQRLPQAPAITPPSSPGTTPAPESIKDSDSQAEQPVAEFLATSPIVNGPVTWRTRARITLFGRRHEVLVTSATGDPQAACIFTGAGCVLLVASCDVFSNKAMLDPVQAELAVRLIEYAVKKRRRSWYEATPPPIIISEFLNTTDSYRNTGILMSPALRSGTLQLIAVALLCGWYGFHRFGPAKRSTARRRRSLIESAQAIGNLQYRSRGSSEAVRAYLEYMKTQLQRLFGPAVSLQDTDSIALRARLPRDVVEKRIAHATQLAEHSSRNAAEAASAIRDLADLLHRLHGTTH